VFIRKSKAGDCGGPFEPRTLSGTLSDKTIYMELDENASEKDLKDGSNKIYISHFFNPAGGGGCDWVDF